MSKVLCIRQKCKVIRTKNGDTTFKWAFPLSTVGRTVITSTLDSPFESHLGHFCSNENIRIIQPTNMYRRKIDCILK